MLKPETAPGMRLDLLVSRPDLGGYLAVELKYLTAAWAGEDDGEHFEVLGQGAQDIRAYDDAFRIYEDQVLSGTRAWGPLTGAGTMKDRASAIELRRSYRCRWSEYSALPGSRGTFRVLALAVGARDTAARALIADRQPRQTEPPGRSAQATPRDAASQDAARGQGTAPAPGQRYSVSELRTELLRFERELREAGLKDTSVTTYVDRSGRFLKWLEGGYQPRRSNLRYRRSHLRASAQQVLR